MVAVGYTSGDPRKVDVAGDTMTGDLVLPGNPDQPLEAATKAYVDASGGGGGASLARVQVVTGNEERPDVTYVDWFDSRDNPTDPPTNIQDLDIWYTGAIGPPDVNPPTVPENLTATVVTTSSITVQWSPSTDDVGVVGYQQRLDSGPPVSGIGTTATFTDLDPETEYDVDVRAFDAAGNFSDWSTPLPVTTLAVTGSAISVFADANPLSGGSVQGDGTPNILLAMGFYVTEGQWEIVGVRLWVPGGASVPTTAAVYGWHVEDGAAVDITDTETADASGTMTAIDDGQWNEHTFATPFDLTVGDRAYLAYDFGNGQYVVGGVGDPAVPSGEDPDLVLAEGDAEGVEDYRRCYFRIGTGSQTTPGDTTVGYGLDVLAFRVA
jgi:hypothetical protein